MQLVWAALCWARTIGHYGPARGASPGFTQSTKRAAPSATHSPSHLKPPHRSLCQLRALLTARTHPYSKLKPDASFPLGVTGSEAEPAWLASRATPPVASLRARRAYATQFKP